MTDVPDSKKTAPNPFPVWQTHLIKHIGLPTKQFREIRDTACVEGTDYRRGKLNHVEFTEAGAEKMRRAALQKPPALAPDAPPLHAPNVPRVPLPWTRQLTNGTPLPVEIDVELLVAKTFPKNRRLLQAHVVATGWHPAGELVTVRVRDNSLFTPGQRVLGRHAEGGIYDYAGKVKHRGEGAR